MIFSKTIIIGIFMLIVLAGFLGYQLFFRLQVKLPKGEAQKETITVPVEEQNFPSVVEEQIQNEAVTKKEFEIKKEIFVTDGVKHSVPLEEILSGGPPKDGIPSIDNPKFIFITEADEWLKDTEPGVAFSRGNTHRFYPYQILVWHEIVNDTVEGERILVSYCPLCLTGFVFDPLVKGERVDFGTSGKLWKSNLVMYDRKTDSLWPQILGEAIVGEMTGATLKLLESDQIRYGEWKRKFSNGQVLSRDTGATRFYGSSPYGDYFAPTDFAQSLARSKDTRLPPEALVFGIVMNNKTKAYFLEAVKIKGEVIDNFEGATFVLRYEKDLDVVRMFKKNPDGSLARVNPFSAFWFSWSAVHPNTELLK